LCHALEVLSFIERVAIIYSYHSSLFDLASGQACAFEDLDHHPYTVPTIDPDNLAPSGTRLLYLVIRVIFISFTDCAK
jgi:hypothetical protein